MYRREVSDETLGNINTNFWHCNLLQTYENAVPGKFYWLPLKPPNSPYFAISGSGSNLAMCSEIEESWMVYCRLWKEQETWCLITSMVRPHGGDCTGVGLAVSDGKLVD